MVIAKYSVVIAAGGRHALLKRCLQSVLAQTHKDYEVIVVDYGAEPPIAVPESVRLIRWEPDGGWCNPIATNIGVAHASGEWLVILNADIIMADDLLAIAHRWMERQGDCQLYWDRLDLAEDGESGVPHGSYPHGDFLCVRRARYMNAGGYDERMTGWGAYDTDLAWRLGQLGCRELWGDGDKVFHQYHEPQPNKNEDRRRNTNMHLHNVALRRLIVNEGLATFKKYRW